MKVLIADDEALIRFGLKSMIEELELPLTVIEAVNGDELIQAAEHQQPEIGLVDIRMPGVNGLQAIRRARKVSAATRWVILTSHAEFDYASEAIQLGVGAYLLKPAGPAQLKNVLGSLVEEITRERTSANAQFAQSLILGLDASGRGSPRPPFLPCWAGVLQLDFAAALTPLERASRQEKALEALRELSSPSGDCDWLATSWAAEPGTLRVVMAPHKGGTDDLIRRWQTLVTAFVKQESEDIKLSGSGSGSVSSWAELVELFQRCDTVLAYRCVLGTGTFRDSEDWSRRVASLSAVTSALGAAIDGFLKAWDKGHGPDLREFSEKLVERFAASGGWETGAKYLAYRTGIEAPHDEGAEAWALRFLQAARLAVPEVRKSVDAQVRIVEGIDEYLSLHLVDEVRVPDIAAFLSLSPNYLSSLYRKVAGTTISGRLTELRLTRARELLSLPGNAVKTVAMEVGYKSTRHFARLYRGRFGHLPSGR